MKTILVTGGAGFIGSNFVLQTTKSEGVRVVNLDKLTYAGNLNNFGDLRDPCRHVFVLGDVCNRELVRKLLHDFEPDAIVHFAAESHVDRSILGPEQFIRTNIEGTFRLLDEVRNWWTMQDESRRQSFRFLHVSTDEVYGSLSPEDPAFEECTPYRPNSPYAASKAAADHLVRAYHKTYGLPTLVTNCSNNYGPHQFPEKLVPLVIARARALKPIPVYGDGMNVRDWVYVLDHCSALRTILHRAAPGSTYNIGGNCERTNLDVVNTICELLDHLSPAEFSRRDLIEFVQDRPGHDRRYAINSSRLQSDLGWHPAESFESGMKQTVQWYMENAAWSERILAGTYQQWVNINYGQRENLCGA